MEPERRRFSRDIPRSYLGGAFGAEFAVPGNWVICDGRTLSQIAYAELFLQIGGFYGSDDVAKTFRVPNLRGRTLFGADAMGGNGANRLTGSGGLGGTLGAVGGSEAVTLTAEQMPRHGHNGSTGSGGGSAATTTGEAGGHDHGGSTGGAGGHSHTASTSSAGAHSHSGNTGTAGSHTHDQGYSLGTAGSGGTNRVMNDLQPTGAENGIGINKVSGSHAHSFDTNSAGAHSHDVTVGSVGDHGHSISSAPTHTHSVPAIAAHTHSLTIDAAGSDAAHANVPPGAVVIWAIRA